MNPPSSTVPVAPVNAIPASAGEVSHTICNDSYFRERQPHLRAERLSREAFWQDALQDLKSSEILPVNLQARSKAINDVMSEDVNAEHSSNRLIVTEHASHVMLKACELFIQDLTLRSFQQINEKNTLNPLDRIEVNEDDVLNAIADSELHDIFMK